MAVQAIDPVPPQLPEEEFWEKYNDRLEFPLSTVGTIFLHVMVAAGLFVVLAYLVGKPEDKETVPISFVDIGGLDDSGLGSEGGGGDDIISIQGEPLLGKYDDLPDPNALPNPTENRPNPSLTDPSAKTNSSNSSAFSGTDSLLNPKNVGSKGAPGKGGTGPGGKGNDASRARQKNWSRWVISFNTFEGDGQDYLHQIGSFGAVLVVPRADPSEDAVFTDLLRSIEPRFMSHADTEKTYQGFVWFSEDPSKYSDAGRKAKSRRTIADVSRALKLNYQPDKFWAVFPREVDKLLADRETAFIARVRSETQFTSFSVDELHTTVFAVDRLSGGKQVEVVRALLSDEKTAIVVQNGRLIVRDR